MSVLQVKETLFFYFERNSASPFKKPPLAQNTSANKHAESEHINQAAAMSSSLLFCHLPERTLIGESWLHLRETVVIKASETSDHRMKL